MLRTRSSASTARTREHGFTLVEILVAMIIIIALMALAIIAFRGSKTATYEKEARAAGAAYAQGISAWQADHANRVPGAADFMNPASKGPTDLLGKPYLPSEPSGVAEGRIGFSVGANCGTAPAAPTGTGVAQQSGWVSFCPETAPHFGVRVMSHAPGSAWTAAAGAKVCWFGNTAKAPRCAA
jgi:type II secretory pathway pseudopilin PulG